MALRFGPQSGGLESGLLFAAPTVFVGVALAGTGSFDGGALEVAQSGSGSVTYPQQAEGAGAFAVELEVAQTGEGLKQRQIFNTNTTIEWSGGVIEVAFYGEGAVQLPQTVAGSGAWSVELEVAQAGDGTAELITADGSGTFEVALAVSQTGAGEAVAPITGSGIFQVALAVAQSGDGIADVDTQIVGGTGSFSVALAVAQDGSGTSVFTPQQVSGAGQFSVALSAEQSGQGDAGIRQLAAGDGAFDVELEVEQHGGGTVSKRPPTASSQIFRISAEDPIYLISAA